MIAKNKILAVSLIALGIIYSYSDDRSSARATAMAFSSMVSSIGTDAYGINPANFDYHKELKLKLPSSPTAKQKFTRPRWEFSMLSVGGGYGSDSSIDFYNNYLSYLSIDRQKFVNLFTDINEVLKFRNNILPGKRTDVNYDFELKWLSANFSAAKFGTINVTVSDKVGLNTNVFSRDEALPLTFGIYYDPNSGKTDLTNVQLKQAEAIAWWIRKYTIGYAKQFDFKNKSGIKSFSIGFSAGLVNGFGNVSTYESKLEIGTWGIKNINGVNHVDSIKGKQDFHTQSSLTDFFRDYKNGAEAHFNLFPKPAGTGYSFDFGMALQIGDSWRIAASVTDIGKISWNYNTTINNDTNSFAYYDFFLTPTDPTYNAMVDDLGGYNTLDSHTAFTSDLPTKYRAGIMFQPSNKLMVEFDWVLGANNLPGNTDKNIFSLGAEYFPVYFVPVRTGVSVGGPGDFYISLGAGIKFKNFTMDVGTHGINQLFTNKRFSVAFSSRIFL